MLNIRHHRDNVPLTCLYSINLTILSRAVTRYHVTALCCISRHGVLYDEVFLNQTFQLLSEKRVWLNEIHELDVTATCLSREYVRLTFCQL